METRQEGSTRGQVGGPTTAQAAATTTLERLLSDGSWPSSASSASSCPAKLCAHFRLEPVRPSGDERGWRANVAASGGEPHAGGPREQPAAAPARGGTQRESSGGNRETEPRPLANVHKLNALVVVFFPKLTSRNRVRSGHLFTQSESASAELASE